MTSGERRVAVHIGYHKTATTWLQQRVLRRHPGIQPYVRTGHPWDDEFLRYLVASPDRTFSADEARSHFERGLATLAPAEGEDLVVVSAERLSGHPFTGGHDSFRLAERLVATIPEAQVFWVVRNQLDMVESMYKQLLGEGYRGRLSDLFEAWHWKSERFDLGHYEYDHLAAKYQSLFGDDRVGVFTYETLVDDRDAFLSAVWQFLDVAPAAFATADEEELVHRSFPNRGLGLVRFLNRFRRTELNPSPPLNFGSWWRTPVAVALRGLPPRTTLLSDVQRAELRERFQASNERLVALVPGDFRLFLRPMEGPRP